MRAEGVAWRRRDDMAGSCALCRGIIPAGEWFLDGKQGGAPTGEACLTCVLTAVAPILPGNPPRPVTCERDILDSAPMEDRFSLMVGMIEDLGTLTVDREIREDQQVPALLTLVCGVLARRAAAEKPPAVRYAEAGDGWCFGGPAPFDTKLLVWVRYPGSGPGEQGWVEGKFTAAPEGGLRGWRFGPREEVWPNVEVLAWRPGPDKPRHLVILEQLETRAARFTS